MTKLEKFKCAIGIHGKEENIGLGYGSLYIQGHQLRTECRLFRCVRCGHESGQATCPELPNWKPQSISPEMVRKTSRFHLFEEKSNASAQLPSVAKVIGNGVGKNKQQSEVAE